MDRNRGRGFYVWAGIATGLIPELQVVDGRRIVRPWEWPLPGTEAFRKVDPERYLHPWCGVIAHHADNFERGILPCAGGVLNQPARLMAGIRIYRNALVHCRNRLAEGHARAQEACNVV